MTSPAAPTLHPKRCETCTDEDCPFEEERWGSTWHNDIYYFMRKRGCASHSSPPDADARQRIVDVVKELERAKAQEKFFEGETAKDGFECAVDYAIALLKDGVKRK